MIAVTLPNGDEVCFDVPNDEAIIVHNIMYCEEVVSHTELIQMPYMKHCGVEIDNSTLIREIDGPLEFELSGFAQCDKCKRSYREVATLNHVECYKCFTFETSKCFRWDCTDPAYIKAAKDESEYIMGTCIMHNSIDLFIYVHRLVDFVLTDQGMYDECIRFKRPDIMRYLVDVSTVKPLSMHEAIKSNNLEIVRIVDEHTSKHWRPYLLALKVENDDIIKYFLEGIGCVKCDTCVSVYAVQCGRMDILKYIVDRKLEYFDPMVFLELIKNEGDDNYKECFEYFKYLIEVKKFKMHPDSSKKAARSNNFEILKYIYESGLYMHNDTFHEIFYDVNILNYFEDKGFQIVPHTVNSPLEIVKRCLKKGDCHSEYSNTLARDGNLNGIKMLLQRPGVKIHPHTSIFAARGKHLHIIKYIVEKRPRIPYRRI